MNVSHPFLGLMFCRRHQGSIDEKELERAVSEDQVGRNLH
jgi:hypothetical protein